MPVWQRSGIFGKRSRVPEAYVKLSQVPKEFLKALLPELEPTKFGSADVCEKLERGAKGTLHRLFYMVLKVVPDGGGQAMKVQHMFVDLDASLDAFVCMGECFATHHVRPRRPRLRVVNNWSELGAKLHMGRYSQLTRQCFALEDVARFDSNFASEDLLMCSQSAAMDAGTPRAQKAVLLGGVRAVLCADLALVIRLALHADVP